MKFDDGHDLHAPVGLYKPNDFGMYDVHGNVWEWTSGFYRSGTTDRVARGGGFFAVAHETRSGKRARHASTLRVPSNGLRAARVF